MARQPQGCVGHLTLTRSRREREGRLLCLQHLLDYRIGFCHVPVHEEGKREQALPRRCGV